MNDFILHIGWLTLSMSLVILLVLLFNKLTGKKFSARSRYTVWTVVVLSLCIGIGLFKIPSLFTLEFSMPSFIEDTADVSEQIPTHDERQSPVSNTPATVIPSNPAVPGTDNFAPNENTVPNHVPSAPSTTPTSPTVTQTPEKEPLHIDVAVLIFVIWAIGAVLYFSFGMAVYLRTIRKYDRKIKLCDKQTEGMFRALCRKYGVKRIPGIFCCSEVGSPILYGYTEPTVLLPDIKLSANSLVGVLAHELTHYRRGDIWIKLACLLVESLYWFNPIVYLATARCNAEMELSCDEEVLAGMDEDTRRSYGNVMLEIVEHCSRKRSLLTTQFNPQKNAVKERIMNILDMTKKKRGRVIIAVALMLCIVAGTVIGCGVTNTDESKDNPDIKQAKNTDIIAYDELSDFLNDEQIAVYETAYEIFGLFVANPAGVEGLHYEGSGFSESEGRYNIGNLHYDAARGKYQSYPEFRDLCLTAFTEAYYDEINRTGTDSAAFIERDNRLYYRDTALGGEFGHDIDEYPDTYELISRSDTEIRFNVVGYYKNSGGGDRIYTLSKCAQPITMVLTENGWRFSLFADTAHIPTGLMQEKVADYYFGKHSIAELLELSVIYQGEEILLGDWFEKNEMNPYKYAILDLNGDYSREMVFGLAKGPNNENTDVGSLILHSQDDNVYAHLLYTREFNELKSDGTFWFSGSVSNNGIGKLGFSGDTYTVNEVVRRKSEDNQTLLYYIENQEVSEAEHDEYITEYNRKNAATWYYIYDVDLHSGAKATLYLNGNDPNWYAEVQTAQIDDTGVPNSVVLHTWANGTGISIYHAYVLDGTTGNLIPITPVDEVIENNVELSSNDDAWILKISGKDYTIDKAQFANYPTDMICDIPRFDFIQQFDVVNDQLICKVGIFCAGDGTGFAEENLYIRYGYDNGKIIPVEISVQKGNEYVSQDNAPIQGAFADEDVLSSGNYHEFIADDSEYMVKLIFRANEVLKDVHFSSLEYDDNGTLGVAEKLYTLSELTPDKPLVTGVVFYGSMTTYGISFVDADNQKHYCAVYISGQDGALMVEEVQDYMSNDTNQPSTSTVVITDIEDYEQLGNNFYNSFYECTKAILTGDTETLDNMGPKYAAGTFEEYKNLKFGEYSIYYDDEVNAFVFDAEVINGIEGIPAGQRRFVYQEYPAGTLVLIKTENTLSTEASEQLSELLNLSMGYDLDVLDKTEYIIGCLYEKTGRESFTKEELSKYAETVFGITDFEPDSQFYKDGQYSGLPHGGTRIIHDIVSTEGNPDDGIATITVRFYADFGKTVYSHLISYQMTKSGDDYIFLGQEMIEERALQPKRHAT